MCNLKIDNIANCCLFVSAFISFFPSVCLFICLSVCLYVFFPLSFLYKNRKQA